MSLDSIIKISIDTQSLSMAQKGFGVPLILGFSKDAEKAKVEFYKNAYELPNNQEAAYKMASAIFSQNPTVSLVKIGFVKTGTALNESIKSISDIDSDFYGLLTAETPSNKDLKAIGAILESNRLILGLDLNDISKEIVKDIKSDRIFCMYSPAGEHLAAAWMGKMLSRAPGSSTWAYQELKNVASYNLSSSLANDLEKTNINRYLGIKGVGVTLDGKMCSGKFIDITQGIDWLHVRMQERLFRLLMLNKKIPYTLKGIDLVRSEILAQLKEAIYQGVLAEDPEPQVSAPSIQEIEEQVRGDRVLPKIRFNGRLAGAIHKIEIQGTVTV